MSDTCILDCVHAGHTFRHFKLNSVLLSVFQAIIILFIGWKIGYLGMARFLGSFSGGLFWGWLADNLGRRPSLLIGLIGSIIFGTLFGLRCVCLVL